MRTYKLKESILNVLLGTEDVSLNLYPLGLVSIKAFLVECGYLEEAPTGETSSLPITYSLGGLGYSNFLLWGDLETQYCYFSRELPLNISPELRGMVSLVPKILGTPEGKGFMEHQFLMSILPPQ